MFTAVKFAALVLALETTCSAQDGLIVQNTARQKWPAAEAQQIYLSACEVVQREFGRTLPLPPRVNLVPTRMRFGLWEGKSGLSNGIVKPSHREWFGWRLRI